jgi:hypothetical protein
MKRSWICDDFTMIYGDFRHVTDQMMFPNTGDSTNTTFSPMNCGMHLNYPRNETFQGHCEWDLCASKQTVEPPWEPRSINCGFSHVRFTSTALHEVTTEPRDLPTPNAFFHHCKHLGLMFCQLYVGPQR